MRTLVAPSSMATSKSAVIPIESSRSEPPPGCARNARASSRRRAKAGAARLGRGLRRRDRHQAGDAQVLPGGALREQPRSASGAAPPLLASLSSFT